VSPKEGGCQIPRRGGMAAEEIWRTRDNARRNARRLTSIVQKLATLGFVVARAEVHQATRILRFACKRND
jgi:hypothetical protein